MGETLKPHPVSPSHFPIDKRATFLYTSGTVKIYDFLTPNAFAKMTGIPARTVQLWCKLQKLPAEQTISKRYKIPAYCVGLLREGFLPVTDRA